MRSTSLGAVLALLTLGCGLDNDATAPDDPGLTLPEPVRLAEPEFASATATTSGWATGAPMPTGRYFHAAAVVNGVVYVVGGRLTNGLGSTSVQAYNPSTNTWTTRAPMLSPGGCGASGVIGGKLYAETRLLRSSRGRLVSWPSLNRSGRRK